MAQATAVGDIITLRSNLQSRSIGAPEEVLSNLTVGAQLQKKSSDSLTKLNVPALLEKLRDVTDPDWKSWYYRRFIALGETRVLELADTARAQAKYSRVKYFHRLLSREGTL